MRPTNVVGKATKQKGFEAHGALKNSFLAQKLSAFLQLHQLI